MNKTTEKKLRKELEKVIDSPFENKNCCAQDKEIELENYHIILTPRGDIHPFVKTKFELNIELRSISTNTRIYEYDDPINEVLKQIKEYEGEDSVFKNRIIDSLKNDDKYSMFKKLD